MAVGNIEWQQSKGGNWKRVVFLERMRSSISKINSEVHKSFLWGVDMGVEGHHHKDEERIKKDVLLAFKRSLAFFSPLSSSSSS